ncbi:MAG TPA: ribosome maturation factor RimM [Gammaproteobacteria bacterium]|jgi:16S rRNA processing protein RimM|nr:ribosome maturation factor RimM [Gammaproteobacteria bacterium]
MPKTNSTYIIIGKIGAPFGIKGWLKIQTFTEYGADILEYSPWYLSSTDDKYQEITIEDAKEHGGGLIVKFTGVETPEEARLYTSKTINITRSQLPELAKNEYYWSDLVGLTVINQRGETLGKIIYLIETGSNDVLVVKGEKEIAIPYLPGSVVLNIDIDKQEMQVNWEEI